MNGLVESLTLHDPSRGASGASLESVAATVASIGRLLYGTHNAARPVHRLSLSLLRHVIKTTAQLDTDEYLAARPVSVSVFGSACDYRWLYWRMRMVELATVCRAWHRIVYGTRAMWDRAICTPYSIDASARSLSSRRTRYVSAPICGVAERVPPGAWSRYVALMTACAPRLRGIALVCAKCDRANGYTLALSRLDFRSLTYLRLVGTGTAIHTIEVDTYVAVLTACAGTLQTLVVHKFKVSYRTPYLAPTVTMPKLIRMSMRGVVVLGGARRRFGARCVADDQHPRGSCSLAGVIDAPALSACRLSHKDLVCACGSLLRGRLDVQYATVTMRVNSYTVATDTLWLAVWVDGFGRDLVWIAVLLCIGDVKRMELQIDWDTVDAYASRPKQHLMLNIATPVVLRNTTKIVVRTYDDTDLHVDKELITTLVGICRHLCKGSMPELERVELQNMCCVEPQIVSKVIQRLRDAAGHDLSHLVIGCRDSDAHVMRAGAYVHGVPGVTSVDLVAPRGTARCAHDEPIFHGGPRTTVFESAYMAGPLGYDDPLDEMCEPP